MGARTLLVAAAAVALGLLGAPRAAADDPASPAAVPAGAVIPPGGLSDDALVQSALANSERVRLVVLDAQQGQVEVDQARARLRPHITGSLDFTYFTNPLDPVIVRTGEFGTYNIGGVATQVPPQDVRVYEGMEPTLFRLSGVLEQPVFTWGKLDLGVELAEQARALRESRVAGTELDVTLELRGAAAAVRHLAVMAEVAAAQTDLSAELVRLVRAAFESGAVVRTDVLEAEVGTKQAALAETEIANQLQAQLVTVRRITGIPGLGAGDLCAPRFEAASGTVRGLALRPADELVYRALEINPGLAALRQARVVAASRRELAAASQRLRPDFGLQLELSLTGPRIPLEPDWYGKDEFNLTVSIGLQSTLYDGGLGRGDTEGAVLDEAAAAEQLADASGALADGVRQAALAAELALARISYHAANAELLEARLAVRRREFDAGVGSRDGVIRAELALLANRLEMERELLALEGNVVALEVLTGVEVVR